MIEARQAPERVAYGCSKLLYLYLTHSRDREFSFVVDKSYPDKNFCGIEVISPDEFLKRQHGNMNVYVFAVSNGALDSILAFLSRYKFKLGQSAFLYSDLFKASFEQSLQTGVRIGRLTPRCCNFPPPIR